MRRGAWITWTERAVDLAALATGAVLWVGAPGVRVAITWPMLVVIAGAVLRRRPGARCRAHCARRLVLGLAAVAAFGHLTRNVVVVFRQEPAHRNVVF
jgi:hypothetical protein